MQPYFLIQFSVARYNNACDTAIFIILSLKMIFLWGLSLVRMMCTQTGSGRWWSILQWYTPNRLKYAGDPTDLGKRSSRSWALGGHGQHSCDAQTYTGRGSIHVDPEGHPRQNDNQETGNVHLDQIIAHLSLQVETSLYAGELPWNTNSMWL